MTFKEWFRKTGQYLDFDGYEKSIRSYELIWNASRNNTTDNKQDNLLEACKAALYEMRRRAPVEYKRVISKLEKAITNQRRSRP